VQLEINISLPSAAKIVQGNHSYNHLAPPEQKQVRSQATLKDDRSCNET